MPSSNGDTSAAAKKQESSAQVFLRRAEKLGVLPNGDGQGEPHVAYYPAALASCCLPHREPANGHAWSRWNGRSTLIIHPAVVTHLGEQRRIGYPCGVAGRLLLAYLTTYVVHQHRTDAGGEMVQLSASTSDVLRFLGKDPRRRGKGSSADALRDQVYRVVACHITIQPDDADREGPQWVWEDLTLVQQGDLSSLASANGADPFSVRLRFHQGFMEHALTASFPFDVRVVLALAPDCLAIDLYLWATWRAGGVQRPMTIPWDRLAKQFGSAAGVSAPRVFKGRIRRALAKVRAVYPTLRLYPRPNGLAYYPSAPHISRRRPHLKPSHSS